MRRGAPRKEEGQRDEGDRKQRASSGPIKVAVLLKSPRSKSSSLRPSALGDSAQSENKKNVSVGRKLSTSSLGSEAPEEGPLGSPRKAAQAVSDNIGAGEGGGAQPQSEDAPKCVEDQREGARKSAVEKQGNHIRVSTEFN